MRLYTVKLQVGVHLYRIIGAYTLFTVANITSKSAYSASVPINCPGTLIDVWDFFQPIPFN